MTFIEVGQHSSLTSAAKSMCLTTGAISQQLLQLEQKLGLTLVERHSRGIRLTEVGSRLHQVAKSSLEDIDAVLAQLDFTSQQSTEIRLKLTPSFAFKWLVPRLEAFHRLYPDIQVQTFAEGAIVDKSVGDFDIAIDYGELPYLDSHASLLFEEYLVPVASPHYLKTLLAKGSTENSAGIVVDIDWTSVTLLHDAQPWLGSNRDQEWSYWANKMNLEFDTNRGHFFNRTDMAMAAAEASVGVALARKALIKDELETGRLVALSVEIKADAGYFALTHSSSRAVQSFLEWLSQQIEY
ncbi:LysR substrate-binding domain-containing protein [Vibrio gallaecicus]|uniref:LysR substrate-binding domain-containing protein n=2 Tax=Vibrio gallaecicus TaxID=552386 RepID=A0ABV4NDL3_9VIBR